MKTTKAMQDFVKNLGMKDIEEIVDAHRENLDTLRNDDAIWQYENDHLKEAGNSCSSIIRIGLSIAREMVDSTMSVELGNTEDQMMVKAFNAWSHNGDNGLGKEVKNFDEYEQVWSEELNDDQKDEAEAYMRDLHEETCNISISVSRENNTVNCQCVINTPAGQYEAYNRSMDAESFENGKWKNCVDEVKEKLANPEENNTPCP